MDAVRLVAVRQHSALAHAKTTRHSDAQKGSHKIGLNLKQQPPARNILDKINRRRMQGSKFLEFRFGHACDVFCEEKGRLSQGLRFRNLALKLPNLDSNWGFLKIGPCGEIMWAALGG